MLFDIYGLIDPRTLELFYVGCTLNMRRRLTEHLKRIHWVGHNEALGQRIRNFKQAGLIPSLVVFERTEDKTRELVWIIKGNT